MEQILSINKRIHIDEEVVNVSKANAHQDVPVRIAKEDWKWCVCDEKGSVRKEAVCDSEGHGRKLIHQLCRNELDSGSQWAGLTIQSQVGKGQVCVKRVEEKEVRTTEE